MRVVVVDAEATARRHTVRSLEGLGHQVVGQAADWEQALERVRAESPDAVLLELAMPGHGGQWIAGKMQEMGLEARVVFMADPQTYALANHNAPDGCLQKPLTAQALRRALEGDPAQGEPPDATPAQLGLEQVWFFREEGGVVLAYDGRQEQAVAPTLEQLQEHYGERLVRIHRHYLVDCRRLERLESDRVGGMRVWLKGYDTPLPVGRHMENRVRGAMNC